MASEFTHTFEIDINGQPLEGEMSLGSFSSVQFTQTPEVTIDQLGKIQAIFETVRLLAGTCTVEKIEILLKV